MFKYKHSARSLLSDLGPGKSRQFAESIRAVNDRVSRSLRVAQHEIAVWKNSLFIWLVIYIHQMSFLTIRLQSETLAVLKKCSIQRTHINIRKREVHYRMKYVHVCILANIKLSKWNTRVNVKMCLEIRHKIQNISQWVGRAPCIVASTVIL